MFDNKFKEFLNKITEACGLDRLRSGKNLMKLADGTGLFDSRGLQMMYDMVCGNVFDLFLDEPEDAYEKSFQFLKITCNHEENEIRSYLDVLQEAVEHRYPDRGTENEKMLKEGRDHAFGTGVCQDYERAAKDIEETTIWECPQGNYICLMSAIKGEDNDISQILNGESARDKLSPVRYGRYKEYVWTVEDDEEVVDLLVECAEQGVPEAQYLLGCEFLKWEEEDGTENSDYDEGYGRTLIAAAADLRSFDAINKIQEIEKWDNRL